MSKLNSAVKVPNEYRRSDLINILTQIDSQVNNLSEGRITASYNAGTISPNATAVPSSVGDQVRNAAATVQGTVGAQYVITGWICTTAGTPGVWQPMRTLTGS